MSVSLLILSSLALPQVGWGEVSLFSQPAEEDSRFGSSLDSIRDVNGDGIQDVVVGAWKQDTVHGTRTGAAYLISGADGTVIHEVPGEAFLDQFGWSVAGLDDLDGDDIPDFAVSAPGAAPGGLAFAGSIYIFSGADASLIQRLDSDQAQARFGWVMANAGDANGDGISDLITGSPYLFGRQGPMTGGAFLISGADRSRLRRFHPIASYSDYGKVVDGAGDVDGDGLADVIVGAPRGDFPSSLRGIAHIYSGATGLQIYAIRGEWNFDYLATQVAGVGDLDLDGHGDFLVSSPVVDNSWSFDGGIDIHSGRTGEVLFTGIRVEEVGVGFGEQVAAVGDVDSDGIPDFAVSAPRASPGGILEAGAVYLYSGRHGELLHDYHGVQAGAHMGQSLAGTRKAAGGWQGFLIGADSLDTSKGPDSGGVLKAHFDPLLRLSATSLSRGLGGTAILNLEFPPSEAGFPYRVLLSNTGDDSSGFYGHEIHLIQDAVFLNARQGRFPPALQGGTGLLDAHGHATATFQVPAQAPAGLVGTTRWFAAVCYNPGGAQIRFVSATAPLTIVE